MTRNNNLRWNGPRATISLSGVWPTHREPEINFSKAVLGATIALIGLVLLLIACATAAWAQVDQGNGLSDPEQYRTAFVFILGIAAWAPWRNE